VNIAGPFFRLTKAFRNESGDNNQFRFVGLESAMNPNWQDQWPHKWFMIRNSNDPFRNVPRVVDAVEPGYFLPDLPQIAHYLESAPVYITSSFIDTCATCGQPLRNSSTWMWDGKFLWPADLSHFVRSHSVKLPRVMLERIRALDYKPPEMELADIPSAEQAMREMVEYFKIPG
jgi:hypothetical protein